MDFLAAPPTGTLLYTKQQLQRKIKTFHQQDVKIVTASAGAGPRAKGYNRKDERSAAEQALQSDALPAAL